MRWIILCIFFPFLLLAQSEEASISSSYTKEINTPIRGITLGLHSHDYEYNYGPLLQEIKQTGAKWVSISIKFYQPHQNSNTVQVLPEDHLYWTQLDSTLQQANQLGLNIMLFPILFIEHPKPGQWRGTILPNDKTTWYQSYLGLYSKLAVIAERHQVALFSVGSEFCALETDTEHWILLINHLRLIYTGKLSYSVNWDAMEKVNFHTHLDYLGISAYFSLTNSQNPTIPEIRAAWRPIKKHLSAQQARLNLPFIFTEIGYTSQNGTNTNPWNYNISDKLDLQEQKDCYQALTEEWLDDELLSGIFFYDWFGYGGPTDLGYTLRQKPALQIAKQWFKD